MKTLLCLLAITFGAIRAEAAFLNLNGKLSYNVTVPQCGFRLKGELQNVGLTSTGAIKLVLWATEQPYPTVIPSPANGIIVGEYVLGALGAGFQFNDFTVRTRSELPFINGEFYFTIAVLELTTAGWRNQLFVPTGSRELLNGNFTDQEIWRLPAKTIIPPPDKLLTGDIIDLLEKATGENNRFPSSWQEQTKLTLQGPGRITYKNNNRKATVKYTYVPAKALYNGDKEWSGKLVMSYLEGDRVTYKNTVYLFFQSPTSGSYRSVVKGFLFGDEIGKSNTQGTFKLK